ncbi:hypothetical protein L1049_017065 [Liquidambar formosana]|uniref:Alpha/beta hydrolase fold-3 domain-containing protein n=1 Tax=Liquidambar formosana TaxID=63359 RepID=A0AAP0S0C9_LIQFO
MDSIAKEVDSELLPFIRVYKDGTVERLSESPHVPPLHDPQTNVSSEDITIYLTILTPLAKVLAVSVSYRLAPQRPLPIAYEDCWAALQWVCSHSAKDGVVSEPWLIDHGDFDQVFIGGDSAGANIAHNIAMRTGIEILHGGIKIEGAYLNHPFFWASDPIGLESVTEREQDLAYQLWKFVYPNSQGGIDDLLEMI